MNYPQADLALEKCLKSNPDLIKITSRLIIQNQTTPYTLSHLLHKPIVRIQNREDLPARLLENTPTDHPGINHYHNLSSGSCKKLNWTHLSEGVKERILISFYPENRTFLS